MKLGIQFSSVAQLCLTFCDPMDCSTPGLPVHHRLLEFTQAHEACPLRVVLARGFVCVCKGVSEIAVQGWGRLLAGSRPGRVGLAGLSEDREGLYLTFLGLQQGCVPYLCDTLLPFDPERNKLSEAEYL